MQKLGQHFLKNAQVLEKIARTVGPGIVDGDRIIEIGPGHGELTLPLARAVGEKHCEIFCIEKDHALIGGLELLAAQKNSTNDRRGSGAVRINIAEGDALKLLPSLTSRDCTIVGNIPYYITGKLLRIISELEQKPKRVVLLIQKEVAERICAAPPEMNRLAASVQLWATAAILATVPRKDFSPPPEVDSAVIILQTRGIPLLIDSQQYYRVVRAIFAQPRKTLLNNLSETVIDGTASLSKEAISACLKKIGIDPGSRPQNLSINQLIAVAKAPLWG